MQHLSSALDSGIHFSECVHLTCSSPGAANSPSKCYLCTLGPKVGMIVYMLFDDEPELRLETPTFGLKPQ